MPLYLTRDRRHTTGPNARPRGRRLVIMPAAPHWTGAAAPAADIESTTANDDRNQEPPTMERPAVPSIESTTANDDSRRPAADIGTREDSRRPCC